MFKQIKRTFGILSSVGIASTLALGVITPAAHAMSLVPTSEGEVDVGLGAPLGGGSYIDVDSIFSSIESLIDPSTGTQSRLFVDRAGTDNTYGDVDFLAEDIGTSDGSGAYWFRPVAMVADGSTLLEDGQLEVGVFKFTFAQVMKDLDLNFFDTEFLNETAGKGTSYEVEYADGSTASFFVPKGPNDNIQSISLSNVAALTLNLGERRGVTGDGVNFQISGTPANIPEPGMAVGVGAVAIAGLLLQRNARKTSDLA